MVDKLISELNQRISSVVSGKTAPLSDGASSKFDYVLDNKRNQLMMDKISDMSVGGGKNDMKVMSAENIDISFNESEITTESKTPGKNISDLFSTINNDMLNLDATIEILSSKDMKLTKSQLLACQIATGTTSLSIDMYSKLVQSISQNLNTILQTNLG